MRQALATLEALAVVRPAVGRLTGDNHQGQDEADG